MIGQLAQQGAEHPVVPHQQPGLVMGLQSKSSGGSKQQPHQLHIGGGGLGPEQLHAALQLFMQPLGAAVSRGAAEGAAHGPEPQGAGPLG